MMEAKQDCRNFNQSQTSQVKNLEKNSSPSQFYDLYQKQVKEPSVNKEELSRQFAQLNIEYCPNAKYHYFDFQIKEALLNWRIIDIFVKIGYFQLNLRVLNESINNPFHDKDTEMAGSFGSIYFSTFSDEEIAIKSLDYSVNNSFAASFQSTLKQWSILKICSALGCAPNCGRYMGFDLIVYNDCIQFATERGEQLSRMSEQQNIMEMLSNIKGQLGLIHCFNIVHRDIKPANIVFSSYFKKFVFIDFGFSSIIIEKIGFKSKSYFKGSPQYCTKQMVSLIYSAEENYVDLYFNDLYGVEMTINRIKNEIEKKQTENMYKSKQFHLDFSSCRIILQNSFDQDLWERKQTTIQSLFLYYSFMCFYISKDVESIRAILKLKDNLLFKRYSSEVLIFIHQIYNKVFLPKIFYTYFQKYENISQYRSIQQLQRQSKQCFIRNYSIKIQDKQCLHNVDFSMRYFQINSKYKQFYRISNYQLIYTFLMGKNSYEKIIQSEQFQMILLCLQFDKKSLSFQKKLKLSAKIRYWQQINEQNIIPSIQDIKFVFEMMANYIIEENLTNWKFQNGWMIFRQCIALQININHHISRFLTSSRLNFTTMQDKIIQSCEIINFMRFIKMKQISMTNKHVFYSYATLKQQLLSYYQEIPHLQLKNKQEELIILFFNKFTICDEYNYQNIKLFKMVNSIQIANKRLQNHLKMRIYVTKMNYSFINRFHQESLFNMKQLFYQYHKNPSILQLFDFFSTCIKLRNFLNFHEFQKLCQQIKDIFECPQIYETFTVERYLFLFDDKRTDISQVIKYIQDILSLRSQQCPVLKESCISNEIKYLLNKTFKISLQSYNQNKIIIKQVYNFLKQEIQRQWLNYGPDYKEQLYQVYFYLEFKFRSLILDEEITIQQVQHFEKKHIFYSYSTFFHFYMYLLMNYKIKLPHTKIKHCLQTLYQIQVKILQSKDPQKAMYFFHLISQVSHHYGFQQLTNQQIEIAYSQMKNGQIMYFQKRGDFDLIISTLDYFKKSNQEDKLYKLLDKLIKWLELNPFQLYIYCFIISTQKFYKKNKQIFSYSRLNQIMAINQSNNYSVVYFILSAVRQQEKAVKIHILHQISQKLNKLSNYTKFYIFFYYYSLILDLIALQQKKTLFVINKEGKRFVRNAIKIKWGKIVKKRINKYKNNVNCAGRQMLLRKSTKLFSFGIDVIDKK